MDYRPDATESLSRMPRGVSLYGTLPEQLDDRTSFASRLSQILAIRRRHGIATGQQLDVPQVSHKAMLVMVHQLDRILQVTVLNFSPEPISGSIRSKHLPKGDVVTDMMTGIEIAEVDDLHNFALTLEGLEGLSLLVAPRD